MPHLIDTNVAIHFRDRDRPLMQRIYALEQLPSLSILSIVELEGGVHRDRAIMPARRRLLTAMLAQFEVLALTEDVVSAYGDIVAAIGFSRSRIIDRLIAATAIVHDLTLITIDAADFRTIPDLRLEVWPAQ